MAVVRDNPYPGFNFLVHIEALDLDPKTPQGAFREVSGLGVEIDEIEYRVGTERGSLRKLPGLAKYSNVTLKRGVIGDLSVWRWVKQTAEGQVQRSTVRIILLEEERNPVLEFRLRNAWPTRFEGPTLDATANQVAVEVLELCHEGLDLE